MQSVVLAVLGTPSPISYSCFDVVRCVVKHTNLPYSILSANTVAEFDNARPNDLQGRDDLVVLVSDYPQMDLSSLLSDNYVPTIVCADDFLRIAYLSVIVREFKGVDAARLATNSLVNLEPLISFSRSRVALVNHYRVRIISLIESICEILGVCPLSGTKTAILHELGGGEINIETIGEYARRITPDLERAREILESRSPLEIELLEFLAPHYDVLFHGNPLNKLDWPPFALLRPEFPDRLTVGPIDLTGPARFIYYGPYFALPRGRWLAELVIEVSDCYSDNQICIDVASGEVLAAVKTKLPAQGVYSCQLAFDIRTPSNPLEIRLQLLTGAIEGMLMLRSIRLVRVAPPAGGGEGSRAA